MSTTKLLRIWHVPNVPMPSFTVMVKDIDQAKLVLDVLVNYDEFQFKHNIKPDYSNSQGLQEFDDAEAEKAYNANPLFAGQTYEEYKAANPDYFNHPVFSKAWLEWYDEEGNDIEEHFEAQKRGTDNG